MQNILIHKDNTIIQALEKLNSIRDVNRLILFVYDDNNRVIGSLTDGDIRRSLVSNKDVHRKVGEICFKDFVFEYDDKDFLDLKPLRKRI